MDILAGVDEGPLGVLHWLIWFWYEVWVVELWVLHLSVSVWVVSVLLEEWIAEVLGPWGESLFVTVLDQTVYAIYW